MPEVPGCPPLLGRAFYQFVKALIPTLRYEHVKAHAGQLDNEVVDSVAKALAIQGWTPFQDIPYFLEFLQQPLWDWAWLLIETEVNGNEELPMLSSLVDHSAYGPEPTASCAVFTNTEECQNEEPLHSFRFTITSANVRSLRDKDTGLFSKAGLLAEQFRTANYEVVGLQETRSKNSTVLNTNGYLRLTSACEEGHGGVEIWFNQFGELANSPFGPVTASHCKVWMASSTMMGIECDHPLLDCDFIVIYAPQAARDEVDIVEWWELLRSRLAQRKRRELVLLGDYNAKLGAVTSEGVGSHQWDCEDTAGALARALIVDSNLVLPSTFESWHSGPAATFHGLTGSGTRVDYIAVPSTWKDGIVESKVSDVDLLSGDFDHSAVIVQMSLTVKPQSQVAKPSRAIYDRAAAHENPMLLGRIVASLPRCHQQVDVDKHWNVIEQHCRWQLQHTFPKGARVLRQHYFSAETWRLLCDRKDLHKHLRALDRQEEQCRLRTIFAAWSRMRTRNTGDASNALETLQLIRQEKAVTCWARRVLDGKFRKSRKHDLLQHQSTVALNFQEGLSSSSSKQVFQALRPKRPVNRAKGFKVPKPLPEIDNAEIGKTRYRGRVIKVWEQHFSRIETADTYETAEFEEMHKPLWQPQMIRGFDLSQVPTRAEFEQSLRALSWRKAAGYDGLGAEVWQADPEEASLRLYPLFLKSVARGYIPLQFRGGFLVPLYKNKGSAADPASYRGILLQNTAAKIFAKSWRTRLVAHFGRSAVAMQCGCVKQRGVDVAHLAVRLHQHTAAVRRQAAAILFVDIKAAYYSVVKQLFHDTTQPDGCTATAALFGRLGLPKTALEDFVNTIQDTNLLADSSVPETLQCFVMATISNSWFQVPGSSSVCEPQTGTRPGDPLADLLFSYAMSQILFEVYCELGRIGCVCPEEGLPPGTTWADDTCVLLAGESATIDNRVAVAFSVMHQVLQRHGLTPTYGPGKTAAMISYRGKDSAKFHRRRYRAKKPLLPCLVEHGNSVQLEVVLTYRHLGSIVDGDSLLPEIKTRGALALQACKPLSRSCLANEKIAVARRQQILSAVGVSVLLHNTGAWRRLNEQEFAAWTASVWKLYSCMLRSEPHADFHRRTIEHVALIAGNFSPLALLHMARLRLFASLLASPDDLLPAAIELNYDSIGEEKKRSWFGCVQEALKWVRATTGEFGSFDALRSLVPQDLVYAHPELALDLRRALRRAKKAHLVHLQMLVDLSDADDWLKDTMLTAGWTCPLLKCDKQARERYGCPDCGARFKGEAHLATHRQRVHGTLVAARRFVTTTKCPACKKNFHTRPRVIKHLQYHSLRCLPWLLLHGDPISTDLARSLDEADAVKIGEERRSGIKSVASRMPVDVEEAIIPTTVDLMACTEPIAPVELRGYNAVSRVQLDFVRRWTNVEAGPWTLHDTRWEQFAASLHLAFQECPQEELESFKGAICDMVEEVTWRQDDFEEVKTVQEKLYEIAKHYRIEQQPRNPPPDLPHERLRRFEAELGSLPVWLGLRDHTSRDLEVTELASNALQQMADQERQWRQEVAQWQPPAEGLQRPFYRECYYLILYSGHRREGDIATQFCRICPEEAKLKVIPICLDLCIDTVYGDLMNPTQQKAWMDRIRGRKVVGLHASPPCETYTDARWLPAPSPSGKPRPLRDWDFPWGREALDFKELSQLRMGNILFFLAMRYVVLTLVSGGCASLEHPRGSEANTGRFRVWASSFLERILRHPQCRLVSFCQGYLGQASLKPTIFLAVRLNTLEKHIKLGSVFQGPFTVLGGTTEEGEWKTAKAKAFPPGLCLALARSVMAFASEATVDSTLPASLDSPIFDFPPAMSGPFDPYAESDAGMVMGPDFWRQ